MRVFKGNRQGHADTTFLFSFFQFSPEAQSPLLLSREDTFHEAHGKLRGCKESPLPLLQKGGVSGFGGFIVAYKQTNQERFFIFVMSY